ncbi:MAG: PAS domain-containing protein [Chloroflexi bacterium]|nr:PAS domain-containing protein [Chloroflexota bacterium]
MWSRWLNKFRTWILPAAADFPANAERYRLIASVMSDYVFSLEYAPNGEIKEQWISGAFSAITGYTPEEFFARGGWVSIVHPDDREQDERDMTQLRANQKVVSEVRIIHKEGHICWVRTYAHPHWDSQHQQLIGLYGAVQDITESKQIEASLRQREAILQVVADAANLFLQTADWRLNIDLMLERLGKTIKATHAYVFEHYTNPQGEWLSTMKYEWAAPGYASEVGQPDFQEISLDDEEFTEYFQTLKSGEPYVGHPMSFLPVEREYFHSLGIKAIVEVPLFVGGRWWGTIGIDDVEHEREWSNAEVDALKIAAGILSGAIEREQADHTLRQSESLYRRAIETAGAVPYFRDRINPSYQFMGEGIRQITGYGPEEMTPALFESLVQEAVMLGDSKGLTVMEAGGLAIEGKISVWKCDMRLVMPDGQSRWVNDSSVELIWQSGCFLWLDWYFTGCDGA